MIPLPLLAAASGDLAAQLTLLLGTLAAILILTKVLGDLAQRVGQPAVLGELVAGIILGPSIIGLLDPADPVVFALGELGVLILLFQIGLHTDLKAILRVGAPAAVVGMVGVILPFLGGYYTAHFLGVTGITAIVFGAAMTATSIGISARVLSDLGQLQSQEGAIVLGAAVLDDVVGLIILWNQFFPIDFSFLEVWWPLILVLGGVYLIGRYLLEQRRRQQAEAPEMAP